MYGLVRADKWKRGRKWGAGYVWFRSLTSCRLMFRKVRKGDLKPLNITGKIK